MKIGTGTDWVYVQAGYVSSIGIKVDGRIWIWGTNEPQSNVVIQEFLTPTEQNL